MTIPCPQPSTTDSYGQDEDDITYAERPSDAYPEPETAVIVSDRAISSAIETLNRFEDFFRRHASPAVHNELRTYVAGLGWHPITGTEALLDNLGFDAHSLQRALNASDHRTAESTHTTHDLNR
jgi:hypothetical protein